MLMKPVPLGKQVLSQEILEDDKKNCRKSGNCGVGKRALYIGSRLISRFYYISWPEIHRVFKRVAMSRGGFTGKGLFGSAAYLVVQYGSGQERECLFKREQELDILLDRIRLEQPQIPTHSVKAEKKLEEAAEKERKRYDRSLTEEAGRTLEELQKAKDFLEQKPDLYRSLSAAARQKRVADALKPSVLAAGTVFGVLGLAAAACGLYGLFLHSETALYFLLGGGIAFFFVFSANLFPNRWNSRKYAQTQWDTAVENCRKNLAGKNHFPVGPAYAHPVVLERMSRVVREGRAETTEQALKVMKEDLRALNASVSVSQEEHDEVVEIKPMFLIRDYQ